MMHIDAEPLPVVARELSGDGKKLQMQNDIVDGARFSLAQAGQSDQAVARDRAFKQNGLKMSETFTVGTY